MTMAAGNDILSKPDDYCQQTEPRPFDIALGPLLTPVPCYSIGLDFAGLGFELGQTNLPLPLASLANELPAPLPIPCYDHSPTTATPGPQAATVGCNTVVDPQDIQNIKIEAEAVDMDASIRLSVPPVSEAGTNIDDLMRTIQLKSQRTPGYRAPSPVSNRSSPALPSEVKAVPPHFDRPDRCRRRSRKSYGCSIPSCTKTFYQKAHLEIHVRAHTGYKPFVRGVPHGDSSMAWADSSTSSSVKHRDAANGFRSSET